MDQPRENSLVGQDQTFHGVRCQMKDELIRSRLIPHLPDVGKRPSKLCAGVGHEGLSFFINRHRNDPWVCTLAVKIDAFGRVGFGLAANLQNGRLRIRLASLVDTVGFNYLYVDAVANTGNLIDGIYFDVELNNSNNPANPVVAFEGNAEQTGSESLGWNSLFVPIDTWQWLRQRMGS